MKVLNRLLHPLLLGLVIAVMVVLQPEASPAYYAAHSAIVMGVLFLLEQLVPYEQRSRPSWSDVPGYLGVGVAALAGALVAEPINGLLASVGIHLPLHDMPLWVQLPLGVVAAELGFYLYHRLGHEWGPLWRIHAVHHLPRQMNIGTYFYMHPLDAVGFGLARGLPLILLGLSEHAIFIVATVTMAQKLIAHSNLGGDLGPLKYVIGTSEMHRMHHTEDPAEFGNYGIVIPLWDWVFGTLVFRQDGGPVRYGIRDEASWPVAWWKRLVAPFFPKVRGSPRKPML